MEHFTLNNGVKIPATGTGTNSFGKRDNDFRNEVTGDFSAAESAIAAGYRLFDTAISYGNESGIGQVIAASGIPREQFFIVGKLPTKRPEVTESRESVRKAVEESMERMRTAYFDLYLIHHPWEDEEGMVRTWHVMEELMREGKFRAIGVSNFKVEHLELLSRHSGTVPAVNQVQCNPGRWNREIIAYCQERGILPMAWGPFTNCDDAFRARLSELGQKYGKSWAQVLLRDHFERGICTIPKSHNPQNQAANLQIFDFELYNEDKALLDEMRK